MTKVKKLLTILILAIISLTPAIAGCGAISFSCNWGVTDIIETPTITLYADSMCIGWDTVANSNKYQIYMNGSLIDSVSKSKSSDTSLVYDFSEQLTSAGNYKFYIVAMSSATFYGDSEPSNTVTYTCNSAGHTPQFTTVDAIDYTNQVAIIQNGARLKFTALDDDTIDSYVLMLYSNSTGLKKYPAEPNTEINLLLKEFDLVKEIYAIRVGAVRDDITTIISDIYYYNPSTYSYNFTDQIYTFDGYINDLYIESFPELRNFMYYMYVYRLNNIQVKLSSQFEELVTQWAGNSTNNKAENFQLALIDAYKHFIETEDAYQLSVTLTVPKDRIYKIKIALSGDNAVGLEECVVNTSILPPAEFPAKEKLALLEAGYDESKLYTYLNQAVTEPYYDNCNYTLRKDDEEYSVNEFDNFISDRQFMSTSVYSSEELYWAVENKVTPIPVENSPAEEIYNLAKNTLRNIISDDMSDYEKTLSIFDWICTNTVYDNYSTFPTSYGDYCNTNVPAYYLEGVFVTGYAVCDGFSKAFSLMCNMEGIDAIRIVGTQNNYGHAWNKVFVDKNTSDNIDGQYYYVDITWSNFERAGNLEDMSHAYFMVSDNSIEGGYPYYQYRDKFANYVANTVYGYYEEYSYIYNGKSYDLVVDSYDDIRPMFYYALHNNLEIIEVIVDKDFYYQVYNDRTNLKLNELNAFAELLKAQKFNEQYFQLGFGGEWVIYNDSGDRGVVFTFEQSLLIDAGSHEVTHLIEYLDVNQLYSDYKLYVKKSILDAYDSDNHLEAVNKLFKSALNTHNVDAQFEYVGLEDDEYLFMMSITSNVVDS